MNPEVITMQVTNLAKAVGGFVKSEVDKLSLSDVEEKGVHDLVTYVDKEAERRLVSELSKIVPGAGFIAEENPDLVKEERFNWIIDPLDGTTNFVHGVPVYSVSIALMEKDELIIGVVYEVNRDECFYAWKGGPAFLNKKQIRVSQTSELESSLLATGFPYHDYSLVKPYLELFEDLMKTTRGIRRLGSAAVDLAYVACGRFELFFEYSLNPWDVAAGALIVKQAGGLVTDFSNSDNFIFGRQIVASNAIVNTAFMARLGVYFDDVIKNY